MDIIFKLILLIPLILSTIFLFINIGIWAIFPFWFLCGLIDVSRHKTMDLKLIKEYFIGKGFLTFLLSPLNLLSDLLSHRNLHTYKIEDLPQGHQNEINDVISLFDKNNKERGGKVKYLTRIIKDYHKLAEMQIMNERRNFFSTEDPTGKFTLDNSIKNLGINKQILQLGTSPNLKALEGLYKFSQ